MPTFVVGVNRAQLTWSGLHASMSHDGGPPNQSGQFLQQLHILGQEIAHNLVEILALLLRDALQTLLQLAVKVNRQTQVGRETQPSLSWGERIGIPPLESYRVAMGLRRGRR